MFEFLLFFVNIVVVVRGGGGVFRQEKTGSTFTKSSVLYTVFSVATVITELWYAITKI